MQREVDVAIIGAGSAGLYALSQVRRYTDSYVMFDGGALGTTCARVGCMPSKLLIQVAEDFHHRHLAAREGISGFEGIALNNGAALEHLRTLRDTLVDRVIANSTAKMDRSQFVPAHVRFANRHLLETEDGECVHASKIIIATGSRPVVPSAWEAFGERVLTTDNLFELDALPRSVAVLGLGVIGLEIGQSLVRMGIEVTGIDQLAHIGGISDPVINARAIELLAAEMPLWLGAPARVEPGADGRLQVSAGDKRVAVDAVFAALGRRPNVDGLNLTAAGIDLDERGVPLFDPNTLQVGDSHIFIAGDCNAQRPILHEAAWEGRVAGYNAGRDAPRAFRRQTPLAITFCDPNLVNVGQCLPELDADAIVIGEKDLAPVGRAMVMGKNAGLIRVYAEKATGRLLGASMVCVQGEHLAQSLAWCIEQQLTVHQLLAMPFYHPTIEEALQGALYDARSKLALAEEDWPVELQPV